MKKNKIKNLIVTITLLSTTLVAETTLSLGTRTPTDIDYMSTHNVKDTIEIPQDTTPFTKALEIMSDDEQLAYDQIYNEKFFSPWTQSSVELTEGERTWQFKYAKEKTYRRDGRRIPKSWYRTQIKNSNFKASDSLLRYVIPTYASTLVAVVSTMIHTVQERDFLLTILKTHQSISIPPLWYHTTHSTSSGSMPKLPLPQGGLKPKTSPLLTPIFNKIFRTMTMPLR